MEEPIKEIYQKAYPSIQNLDSKVQLLETEPKKEKKTNSVQFIKTQQNIVKKMECIVEKKLIIRPKLSRNFLASMNIFPKL
jgi:hypothetical protein